MHLLNSLDNLLRWNDRLFLDWVAGITPLFKRITNLRAPRFDRRCADEVITIDMRLLVHLGVVPCIRHRETMAIGRHLEPFDETRLGRPDSAAGNHPRSESCGFDEQRASVVA